MDFSILKNKKVLITGGAGFIGSNLSEKLLEIGAKVTVLDNFSTGYRSNIELFLKNENFHLIEGDICDLSTCTRACATQDFVLHQAALGSVPRSIAHPIITNNVNIGGFLNMLVAAKDAGVKRMIYAASSSTYGDLETLPKTENVIGKPLSPYAITKYANELYAEVFKKTYDFDTIGLRYFNVFGRKQNPNGAYAAVIPKFVLQFINYQSPIINGDGTYSRDFTYIDNVIQMNLLAMITEDKKAVNQIYNTAAGERITIENMAKMIKKYLSLYDKNIEKVEILYGDNRKGDIPHSLASIEKAQQKLGYLPTHTFAEGLKEAVDWYWKNLK